MKLVDIDKQRYRKHLRWVFAGIAVALTAIAIGASTILIRLLSTPEQSHFWLNVAGVDLLRSNHGPVVMEVNSSPGLEGEAWSPASSSGLLGGG